MDYEQTSTSIKFKLSRWKLTCSLTRLKPTKPKQFCYKVDPDDMKKVIQLQHQVDTTGGTIGFASTEEERINWNNKIVQLKLERSKELDRLVKKYADKKVIDQGGVLTPVVSLYQDQLILVINNQ